MEKQETRFIVKFNTLTGPQSHEMSIDDMIADIELAKHAVSIIQQVEAGVVGMTVQTPSYGRVKIALKGFEE